MAITMDTRCAWCKRIKVNGVFVVGTPTTTKITDGICPECAEREMREYLKQEK